MGENLHIEFDWLDCQIGSDLDRAFAASIGVAVGDKYLTRLDDLGSKTVRDKLFASAWHLAVWFSSNWWRLRWEPAPGEWQKDIDWKIAHSMASAGGGFVWPNAVFASDGVSVEIVSLPKSQGPRFEPVRYINHVKASISTADFEQKVDTFIDAIISRLKTSRISEESLPNLWSEVLKERHDPELSRQRKLEAMAGFDPDQSPEALLQNLLDDSKKFGENALAEVVAETRHKTSEILKVISDLGSSKSRPKPGGYRVRVPEINMRSIGNDDEYPWQRAVKIASQARQEWGYGKRPIKNKDLADILNIGPDTFSEKTIIKSPIPLGVRTGDKNTFDIYFDRPRSTTRRFTACRLLGDSLYSVIHEKLLPATHAKTARQKFQRSFARELLCPIGALLEKLQTTEPDEDDIIEAADYFHVSPLLVRTTLVNYGHLDREALSSVERDSFFGSETSATLG